MFDKLQNSIFHSNVAASNKSINNSKTTEELKKDSADLASGYTPTGEDGQVDAYGHLSAAASYMEQQIKNEQTLTRLENSIAQHPVLHSQESWEDEVSKFEGPASQEFGARLAHSVAIQAVDNSLPVPVIEAA